LFTKTGIPKGIADPSDRADVNLVDVARFGDGQESGPAGVGSFLPPLVEVPASWYTEG
jgi:hypothetical protein